MERTLRVGSSAIVVVKSIAYITLSLTSSRKFILQDCFYVARARRNLISVSILLNSVYSISFDSSVEIKRDGCMIASANLVNGLYLIFYMDNDESLHSSIYESLNVKRKFIESTYLWHLRLRHINLYRIKRLVHNGPLDAIKVEPYPTCESCLMGKMTKTPFPKKDERANDKL